MMVVHLMTFIEKKAEEVGFYPNRNSSAMSDFLGRVKWAWTPDFLYCPHGINETRTSMTTDSSIATTSSGLCSVNILRTGNACKVAVGVSLWAEKWSNLQ